MSLVPADRRLSFVGLCLAVVGVTVLFAVRAQYVPPVRYALAAGLIAIIAVCAWRLGASAITGAAENGQRLAIAGGLLIAPQLLFALLPGFATPWGGATAAENQLRYVVLTISPMAVAAGMIVLADALVDEGEPIYSRLGFAAITLATPLFLTWAAILLYGWSTKAHAPSAPPPIGLTALSDMSDILLFFGGVLTYLATAAFATSLGRVGWLGRGAARAFVVVSLIAALCLAVRGLQFPDPRVIFAHWYDIPGFIFGIPAVPWFIPLMFGVALLRRAGDGRSE